MSDTSTCGTAAGTAPPDPPRPPSNVRADPSVDPLAFALLSTAFRCATYECEANGIGAANVWPMPGMGSGHHHTRRLTGLPSSSVKSASTAASSLGPQTVSVCSQGWPKVPRRRSSVRWR